MTNQTDNKLKFYSKSLSWLLRHGAPQVGLQVDSGGFANISDINKIANSDDRVKLLKDLQIIDYKNIVKNNDKNRFHMVKIDEKLGDELKSYKIRANQGHSFSVPDLELEELDVTKCPVVLHGTDRQAWKAIRESGYLSCMSREYMHFSDKESFEKLGKKHSPVLLQFNTVDAKNDGIKFYKAKNNVILSKGIDGKLSLKYLIKETD